MEVKHNENKMRFELYGENGAHMGEIEYKNGGNNDIYAIHTEVFPQYEGQGHAATLLDTMVAWAEENGKKIVPICPYVIAAFKKHPEKYASVIK